MAKRPEGWNSRINNREAGNAAIETDSSPTELICTTIEKPTPEKTTEAEKLEIAGVTNDKEMLSESTLALLKRKRYLDRRHWSNLSLNSL